MLRHQGDQRTFRHNVRLASLLGITAGFVNAAGFLAFAVLTTNVTGHAALFAERLAVGDWASAGVVALWMLLFLSGAVSSSLIVSVIGQNHRYAYVLPLALELAILLLVAVFGPGYHGSLAAKACFAGSLLFGMGMQNALVSIVSGAVVRTTHLTGTFTDLGIELAQLFRRNIEQKAIVKPRIRLRLVIIFCFMGGALAGGYLFRLWHYAAFYLPAAILCYALAYDMLRIRLKRFYRKQRKTARHN